MAIAAFPLGLLALLVRNEDRIAIELVDRGEATSMIAQGVAPLRVRRAFADLE